MRTRTNRWARAVTITALVLGSALGGGVASAEASPAVRDLPVTATPCRIDTNPDAPSCKTDLGVAVRPTAPTAVDVYPGWECHVHGEWVHCNPTLIICFIGESECWALHPGRAVLSGAG